MKKILKSFKQVFLIDEEVLKNESAVKPQGKCSGKSEEQNKTAAGVSVATNPCQSHTQPDTYKVAVPTAESPGKVQSDGAKCSFQTQSHVYGRTRNNIDCRLFLGGLPDNITGDELRKVFEKYGKVVSVVIPVEKDTNKCKRYGYLEFENEGSANACLDDHFVTVCERRVEVKKAWPRNTKKRGEENWNTKETKEVKDCEKFQFRSKNLETTIDGSLKSLSIDSESNMEDTQPMYQELFEDYFKAKFILQNLLGSEKVSNKALNEDVNEQQELSETEMEKILRGLCVYAEEGSSIGEDSEDCSSDTDETDSVVHQLELDFKEKNETLLRRFGQPGNSPNFSSGNTEEGIICDLCKWVSLDNSIEGFLAHCETYAHKQRLKERFKKNEIPDHVQNKSLTQANPKKVHQKKEQCNKLKKPRKRRSQANKSSLANTENSKKKETKLILNEVIASLEAKTEKCIKCKMCNKTIPQAPNIRVMMTNLSQHLQSKGHLARIHELQQAAQKSKNVLEKNVEAKVNALNKEKTTFNGKTSKNAQNKKKLSDATMPATSESSSNATNTNSGPLNKSKSKSQQNILPRSTTKVKFRCLLCNYFCNKPDTLLAHLNSDPHSANDKRTSSKNVTLSSVWNDLTLCSRCGTCLYGCPNSITNHFVKCKVP